MVMASFSRIRSSQANYNEVKVMQIDRSIRGFDGNTEKEIGCHIYFMIQSVWVACLRFLFLFFLLIRLYPNVHKVFLLFFNAIYVSFQIQSILLAISTTVTSNLNIYTHTGLGHG